VRSLLTTALARPINMAGTFAAASSVQLRNLVRGHQFTCFPFRQVFPTPTPAGTFTAASSVQLRNLMRVAEADATKSPTLLTPTCPPFLVAPSCWETV
jgi:hypothetical protein